MYWCFNRRPQVFFEVPRAEVAENDQLVLELVGPLEDVIEVAVPELVDLLLAFEPCNAVVALVP